MKIIGIIPARYKSTRFPGKPLVDILGKPMIQRVYEQCLKSKSLSEVIVATDDSRIEKLVLDFGGKVMMTSEDHLSGTERCAEVLSEYQGTADVVINIQGDEPFIDPQQIDSLCDLFNKKETSIGTLIKIVLSAQELFNPNSPKVVIDLNKNALYFSRHPIPYLRNVEKEDWIKKHRYYKHIGIYGFRSDILPKITQLKSSSLEIAESLEQNRWLENGFRIQTALTEIESIAIDHPEDLLKINK